MSDSTIHHVSDTALWVATYRARETTRPNPLFQDPLAAVLAGERGQKIEKQMSKGQPYTEWAVVMRTRVIDDIIQEKIAQGVDTILNLGAGLDTRPYRLELPATLRWIEVDFPHMIEHKNSHLAQEHPKCQLERIALDLSDRQQRKDLFQRVASQSAQVLVITEGVIPYLSEEEVETLAEDLLEYPKLRYWLVEYFAQIILKYLKSPQRNRQLKNAPLQFFPSDWLGFFQKRNWKVSEIRYYGQESIKHHRKIPGPWWLKLLLPLIPKKKLEESLKNAGFLLLESTRS